METMKAKHIPGYVIDSAVTAILTARDFCGNEREASNEAANDHGYWHVKNKIYRIANFRANAEWNRWQKAAGVDPKYTF